LAPTADYKCKGDTERKSDLSFIPSCERERVMKGIA